MLNSRTHIVLLTTSLIVCLSIYPGYAQKEIIHNIDNNTFVNFSEIIENLWSNEDNTPRQNTLNFTLKNYGYLLLVKYLGENRKVSNEKKEFLDYFFKTIGIYEKAKDLYTHEVLVETDAGKSWLPIQNELFDYWIKELKNGDLALIYIRAYGSLGNDPENKWIFPINSFNSGYYDGLWEEALYNFDNDKDTIGLRCLFKLISLDPNDGRNYAMLGHYYTMTGKRNSYNNILFIKADSLFLKAEKLTPAYSYQYFQRAILKYYMKDYKQSWFYIEKARDLKETDIEQSFLDDLESQLSYKKYRSTKY